MTTDNAEKQNNLPSNSDEILAKLALKDQAAFAELVNRYQAPLRRYVSRLARLDETDIDDVLQEAFIKLYLNLNDFDPKLKFSSWLYRIVHNETINHFRKRSVKYEVGLDIEGDEKWNEFWEDEGINRIDQTLANEKIQETLNKLSPNYRDVLILKYLEQKNYDEISDILQKPPGTVASWLNRAKTQFRSLYQTYDQS
ncbi:MAG: RNA polymerase sigma factor [Candidatus Falkowbacteria bacterium]|nr:RNA polymerase sigma factor [Candidatus Falkowbacteria bacterium]